MLLLQGLFSGVMGLGYLVVYAFPRLWFYDLCGPIMLTWKVPNDRCNRYDDRTARSTLLIDC